MSPDNVSITPGLGAMIATDDVGGVQYQLIKLAVGVDGAAALASAAGGVPVALDTASLAALENVTVTVSNPSTGAATETTLAGLLAAVDGLEGLLAHGAYAYAAGTAAGTVDVPAGARVRRVSVIAGASVAATITVAGGATITVPAGASFDEQLIGDVALGGDVVIGGTVQSYFVSWTV